MITTSAEYKLAVKNTIRKWHSKVEITWTDPFLDTTIVVDANDKNYIHSLSNCIKHVADLDLVTPHKYFQLGNNDLTGNYCVFPGTDLEATKHEVGWWGATSCNGSGIWVSNPILTVTHTARAISALLVCGDNKYGEYPVSFQIRIYEHSADIVPIYTDSVTDGVGTGWELTKVTTTDSVAVLWKKELTSTIVSCEKYALEIIKWSIPNKVVKIVEFYTNYTSTYNDDDIMSMKITEECELRDGTLPIGNIATAQLELKIQNITNQFYYENTLSPIYTMLKRNRKIKSWIGLELPDTSIEYIPMGIYWSGDWIVGDDKTDALTNARNRLEMLRRSYYETNVIKIGIVNNLYQLAVDVMDDAKTKYRDLTYYVGWSLIYYPIPIMWLDKITYYDALKKIASACLGYVYVDRNDLIIIDTEVTSFAPVTTTTTVAP